MNRSSRVIVALDTDQPNEALGLARRLQGLIRIFKVGSELFTAAGPDIVESLKSAKAEVFLDLKFHDIPNTVARASSLAVRLGVFMLNVHCSGGLEMMKAAHRAVLEASRGRDFKRPFILGVTVLTSFNERSFRKTLETGRSQRKMSLHLAALAKEAGLDGVVASAMEVKHLKIKLGSPFLVVTPGIRPKGVDFQDQERVVTPQAAFDLGADYIVIGRPITQASDPVKAAEAILNSL